jgi:elongation factor P
VQQIEQPTEYRTEHVMKIAQERAGNVIMHGKDPMVVLKTEYAKWPQFGHRAHEAEKSVEQLSTEVVFKADDKMDRVILDKRDCTYSLLRRPDVRLHGRRVPQPVRS